MYRTNDSIKEFKNGNINIKLDRYDLEKFKVDKLGTLSEVLDLFDCYFIGETYCLSNWATGHTIYNEHSDLLYIFDWANLDKLEQGKTVKLYARKPDKYDREMLESEWF